MSDSNQVLHGVNSADSRVRRALADNRRIGVLTALLAVSIFLLAAGLLVTAYWGEASRLVLGGLVLGAVFGWAIRQVFQVRRENRVLESLPVIVRVLPPEEAAVAMMARLRPVRDRAV